MGMRKSWEEFRSTGLLWWINMILHTFGWAICCEFDGNKIIEAYPARVKYRGFDAEINDKGYRQISKYLEENAEELKKETFEFVEDNNA